MWLLLTKQPLFTTNFGAQGLELDTACVCPWRSLSFHSYSAVVNPQHPDEETSQPCPFAGVENPLPYKAPPYPSDTRLCEVSAALEGFALDEEQEPVLRMAARLYRYSICEEDAENDKDWGQHSDSCKSGRVRLALQLSQEPSDINRLLVFWMVKVEANDQIQNIKVSVQVHGSEGLTKLQDMQVT